MQNNFIQDKLSRVLVLSYKKIYLVQFPQVEYFNWVTQKVLLLGFGNRFAQDGLLLLDVAKYELLGYYSLLLRTDKLLWNVKHEKCVALWLHIRY